MLPIQRNKDEEHDVPVQKGPRAPKGARSSGAKRLATAGLSAKVLEAARGAARSAQKPTSRASTSSPNSTKTTTTTSSSGFGGPRRRRTSSSPSAYISHSGSTRTNHARRTRRSANSPRARTGPNILTSSRETRSYATLSPSTTLEQSPSQPSQVSERTNT